MLVDLIKQPHFGAVAQVELGAEIVHDLLWDVSFIHLYFLDVLASIEVNLESEERTHLLMRVKHVLVVGGKLRRLKLIVARFLRFGLLAWLAVLLSSGSLVRWMLEFRLLLPGLPVWFFSRRCSILTE